MRVKKKIEADSLLKTRYNKKFPEDKKDHFYTWIREQHIEAIESAIELFKSKESMVYEKDTDFLGLIKNIENTNWILNDILEKLQSELLIKGMIYKSEIVMVEGAVIFEYKFQMVGEDDAPMWAQKRNILTWMKWLIHENGEGLFTWIVQKDKYNNTNLVTEDLESEERWISIIEEPKTIEKILERARSYPFTQNEENRINRDGIIFMLTKAFIERGYPVQGIKIIAAKKGE